MIRRAHQRRARGYHSLSGSVSVGLALLAMVFIFWFAWVRPASSQVGPCGQWDEIQRHLGAQYLERQVAIGVVSETHVVVVLASPDGKTFSIIAINSNGWACYLAAGTDWQLEQERGI
jgi:hypothetical protein